MGRLTQWPRPERGPDAVRSVIWQARQEGRGGLDLEYGDAGPTIIGVASRDRCAAAYWNPQLGVEAIEAGIVWAAHAGLGADRPVIEKALDRKTPRELWSDTLVRNWCVNPDFASVPKGLTGEDRDDAGAVLGFMNLWVSTSFYHDVPNWKSCVGQEQCLREGRPCPEHNELDYCAVDSWAGLVLDLSLIDEMKRLAIPESYYEWRARLTEYCCAMQVKGVPVDLEVVRVLEESIQSKKAGLFPSTLSYEGKPYKNGKPRTLKKPKVVWQGPFNPSSPKAALEWFSANGVELKARGGKPSIGKVVILDALNRRLRPSGLKFDPVKGQLTRSGQQHELLTTGDEDEPEDMPILANTTDMLLRLVQKAYAGKGVKSWFSPQYMRAGRIHARFNASGTCTSRLACTKPNLQNVARSGWGSEMRRAFVAEPGCKVCKGDFSQLEFRIMLWFAGLDPGIADGAFEMLVDASNGQFQETATRLSWKPRDVAKSLTHGNSYLEGLSLRTIEQLADSREQRAGALWVYDGREFPEWTFRGQYVCFTGANLAERLFGSRSWADRKKALLLQKIVLDAFPAIRELQMRVSHEVEKPSLLTGELEVRLPSGHRVPLYGRSPEDDLKFAAALYGQGGGAIYAEEAMLNFSGAGHVLNLMVHDEADLFDVPIDFTDEQVYDLFRPMVIPSKILTQENYPLGFSKPFTAPAEIKQGPSWKETTSIGVLRWKP